MAEAKYKKNRNYLKNTTLIKLIDVTYEAKNKLRNILRYIRPRQMTNVLQTPFGDVFLWIEMLKFSLIGFCPIHMT